MEFVKNVGPIGMIFIMFSLGLNLSYKDFFEVLKKPRNLIVALICQMLMLPFIGIVIISFFPMQAEFQLGVFLLLILPSAVMSNYATKLVKGNVALSITITSICGLVSFISIPIFLKIYAAFFSSVEFDLNLLKFSVRMFLFIALPTFVGILVRGNFKRFSEQNNLKFDRAALGLFIVILLVAIFNFLNSLYQSTTSTLSNKSEDIIFVSKGTGLSSGFFKNFGKTQRLGFDLSLRKNKKNSKKGFKSSILKLSLSSCFRY